MRMGRRHIVLAMMLAIGWCGRAHACPVPVFRYALEKWTPAPYELIVFHRGLLSVDEKHTYNAIRAFGANERNQANYITRDVDLAGDAPPDDRKFWDSQVGAQLPRIVLLLPPFLPERTVAWSAPLTSQSAGLLMESPARRAIVKNLAAGSSAVWVLVDGARKSENEAVAAMLAKQIAEDQKEVQLPDGAAGAIAEGGPELKVAFSIVRIARLDPAEEVFLKTLQCLDTQHISADLPIAVPIYGRGRIPTAFVGGNITAENIHQCDQFVCGPCACQIKEQNPGVDLLLAASWDQAMGRKATGDSPAAPTTSVAQASAASPPAPRAELPAVSTDFVTDGSRYRTITLVAIYLVIVAGLGIAIRGRADKRDV